MTEREAIERMKYKIATAKEAVGSGADGKAFEDMEMAIQALEEVQAYRAMEKKLNGISVEQVVTGFINQVKKGTHEEYEKSRILTNAEADDWNAYRELGTVEELRELKEKAEPKKVKTRGQGHETDCFCPNCDAFLGNDQHWQFNQTKNCSKCGQSLEEY